MSRLAFLVAVLALCGCGNKNASHFLDAIIRGDYEAAHADLHTKARATTPDAAALKAQVEAVSVRLVSYGATCSVGGFSDERVGYNATTKAAGKRTPLIIGVRPGRRGSCNTSLVVDLEMDGNAMRVVGMKLE